eukprot:15482933-Alexandrium_andersonii.AAC.1
MVLLLLSAGVATIPGMSRHPRVRTASTPKSKLADIEKGQASHKEESAAHGKPAGRNAHGLRSISADVGDPE